MMFARYKGARPGLTEGRVYIVKPQIEDNTMVGLNHLEVKDDDGKTFQFVPENSQFEFLPEVYAVVVKPFDGCDIGEVVVVDDATDKKEVFPEPLLKEILFNVKGLGYRNSEVMCILDRTNVCPGMMVMDITTGVWVKVKMTDEALWIQPDGAETMRSPEEFKFAVSDGGIMVEPLVRCLEAAGESDLTVGRYYVIQRTLEATGCVMVANDRGILSTYLTDRFQMGS